MNDEKVVDSAPKQTKMTLLELLEKAFDAGYECALSHNAHHIWPYKDFDDWFANAVITTEIETGGGK